MAVYRVLADAVVLVHFAYVAFVVLGLAAILLGIARRWQWIRNFWFRAVHFLMIGVVVAESLGNVVCPLTTWENQLRLAGGQGEEAGSFIARWIHRVMFFDAPERAFTAGYCLFGLAVLATIFWAPPRWPMTNKQ